MSWLAKLDARSRQWSPPARWAYVGLKWYLVAVGALALLGVWADRLGLWDMYAP